MAQYIAKANGYIIDNPNIDFVNCNGEVYSYDEVSTFSMSNNSNSVTVTGGQSAYPLAIIDTDKTTEITFASAQFDLAMFAMGSTLTPESGDYGTRESDRFEVGTGLKITIPYEIKAQSVYISDFEEADSVAAGKYTVSITAAAQGVDPKAEITFNTGDVAIGDTIRVSYIRRLNGATKVEAKTNSTSAKGELFAHWPVYSSGTDCSEGAVKGWLHLDIPRCRATALPGLLNSSFAA